MDSGTSNYLRFLDGDEEGIVEIIKDYKDGLMLYLNEYVRNIHVAEDLTEDTFVKIVVKKPLFSKKCTFKTWLYAIGRNIAIDHLRRTSKTETVPTEEALTVSDEESVERAYIRNERKIHIHRIMKNLKPDYRMVLYLVYFENFSKTQIAQIMRKSRKQIDNLIFRAKLSLKSELEKEGFVYEEL